MDEQYGECRQLASRIITRAVNDWHKYKRLTRTSKKTARNKDAWDIARRNGFVCPRDELLAFFRSAWFEMLLAGVTETEPETVRAELGIGG